jgi:hypothetical protein
VSKTGNPTQSGHSSRWLLWSAGALAALLCAGAFLLWGFNGPSMLIDMIVALCV